VGMEVLTTTFVGLPDRVCIYTPWIVGMEVLTTTFVGLPDRVCIYTPWIPCPPLFLGGFAIYN